MDNKTAVKEINSFVCDNAWFDYYVVEFDGNKLVILGSIDLSYFHQIEIHFENVLCFYGSFSWQTDTTFPSIDIPKDNELIELNLKYEIEEGFDIFRFKVEDSKLPIIIAATKCNPIIKEIHYGTQKT